MRAGQETGGSPVGAGLLVSLLAFLAALYLLHRLACLDIGPERAGLAITLMAFAPVAFFFSAVYTESLFLALTVGAVYAGRRERWALAGLLGGAAAATRNSGVLLLATLGLLYLYGPGGRSAPVRGRGRGGRAMRCARTPPGSRSSPSASASTSPSGASRPGGRWIHTT